MKIKRVLFDENSMPMVEVVGEESEGKSNAQPADDTPSAPDTSVDLPPQGTDSSAGGFAYSDSSTTDAASGDASQLEDTSTLDDSSMVLEDASLSEPRHLMTTPLDDYTVTEGLLLIAVIFLALGGMIALVRGR